MKKKKTRRDYLDPITGEKLPGVTTILGSTLGWSKDSLLGWANKIGREGKTLADGRDGAAKKGQCVHALVEEHLMGSTSDEDEFSEEMIKECTPNAERIVKWLHDNEYSVVECERQMVGPGFGGTLDLVLEKNGEFILGDIKTGSGIYDEVIVQLGAYDGLYEVEVRDKPIGRGLVIHSPFGDDIRGVDVTREQLNLGGLCFAALFTVYKARAKIGFKS